MPKERTGPTNLYITINLKIEKAIFGLGKELAVFFDGAIFSTATSYTNNSSQQSLFYKNEIVINSFSSLGFLYHSSCNY